MSEYDAEPIRGLPGELPEDEHIIWQGGPDWKPLALSAVHLKLVAIYFIAISIVTALQGSLSAGLIVLAMGVACAALFVLFLWGVERTTVYTLTNKRIVLRIGVALNACINLPLNRIESANLKMINSSHGSIALEMKGMPRIGYFMLWPHARSMRIVRPQPMLRAIPEAANIAQLLFEATSKIQDIAPENPQAGERASGEQTRNIPIKGLPA